MPTLLPYDTLFAIAFAGGPSLSWKIGSTCSSNRAFRDDEFLSLLRALFISQLSQTINDTRVHELTNFRNTLVVYASQLSVSVINAIDLMFIAPGSLGFSPTLAWNPINFAGR